VRKKKSAGERRRRRGKITERGGTESAERHAEYGSRVPAFHYPESCPKLELKVLFETGDL
jgi:hypothetical protein